MDYKDLSCEQQRFIDEALAGRSILVDACIGSGKTTAIQSLCRYVDPQKRVLYLTYNMLLKLDARDKIRGENVEVTNYHGFAYGELVRHRVKTSVQECIAKYCRRGIPTKKYQVLILDEYQDIDQEIAEMLQHIKNCNPGLQIIAVGDMEQKIYDRTRLNAARFIQSFLPKDHVKLEFTRCFRLNREHAAVLGEIWQKTIVGVNDSCEICSMPFEDAFDFLAQNRPGDILCLGSNSGRRSAMLNKLEKSFPKVFNKQTIWSNISNKSEGYASRPTPGTAIFTTYDGCKGMERNVCVIFDWEVAYWQYRVTRPDAKYKILRNIFCVAASRGKKKIVFVRPPDNSQKAMISKENLMDDSFENQPLADMPISGMFDFKYREDVDNAYKLLQIKRISAAETPINIPTTDALIDLSPCIGMYQEAAYFNGYDIDREIDDLKKGREDDYFLPSDIHKWSVEKKILFLVCLNTHQNRYLEQVRLPFVTEEQFGQIAERLKTRLSRNEEVQTPTAVPFSESPGEGALFYANGRSDVVKGDTVYELKFVNDLAHTHFLQCAMYMVGLQKPRGVLWNVRTNESYEITIPNERSFLNKVARACTKGKLKTYASPYVAQQPSTVAIASRVGAPNTKREIVFEFFRQNEEVCRYVLERLQARIRAGFRATPSMLERLFRDQSVLELPASPVTFKKYFDEYYRLNVSKR